jgi:hypothetical protein
VLVCLFFTLESIYREGPLRITRSKGPGDAIPKDRLRLADKGSTSLVGFHERTGFANRHNFDRGGLLDIAKGMSVTRSSSPRKPMFPFVMVT